LIEALRLEALRLIGLIFEVHEGADLASFGEDFSFLAQVDSFGVPTPQLLQLGSPRPAAGNFTSTFHTSHQLDFLRESKLNKRLPASDHSPFLSISQQSVNSGT
jgi:hypothetical protein